MSGLGQQADIQSAFDSLAQSMPRAVARGSAVLSVLLRNSYARDHPGVWSFSRLTGDGFPLEIAITTAQEPVLRYTADPGGPDLPVGMRLAYALELVQELGQPLPDARLLSFLLDRQRAGDGTTAPPSSHLQYGAWLGGRHAETQDKDCYKLYAELPLAGMENDRAFLEQFFTFPFLPGLEVMVRMIGCEMATGRMEVYFRAEDMLTLYLPNLLRPAGMGGRAQELLACLESLYGRPLGERIPGGSVGFSYSLLPDRGVTAFSLFVLARVLWGGDRRIRLRFAQLLEASQISAVPYRRLTASLAERQTCQTYHGPFSLVLVRDAPVQFCLGLRPPPCVWSESWIDAPVEDKMV